MNPNLKVSDVDGYKVYSSLSEIKEPIDSLTMYVGAAISTPLEKEIIALAPKRVVFNPGSENTVLAKALIDAKIKVVENCTLVMLRSGTW